MSTSVWLIMDGDYGPSHLPRLAMRMIQILCINTLNKGLFPLYFQSPVSGVTFIPAINPSIHPPHLLWSYNQYHEAGASLHKASAGRNALTFLLWRSTWVHAQHWLHGLRSNRKVYSQCVYKEPYNILITKRVLYTDHLLIRTKSKIEVLNTPRMNSLRLNGFLTDGYYKKKSEKLYRWYN